MNDNFNQDDWDNLPDWQDQDMSTCVNCGVEIVFLKTSIDDFWTHMKDDKPAVGKCENAETWAWPVGFKQPKPIELNIVETTHFEQTEGFEWSTYFAYSTVDDTIFAYNFKEEQIQVIAQDFQTEIFFTLTKEEAEEHLSALERPVDNLKNDFVYFKPGVNRRHQMVCTCNNFLESDEPTEGGMNRLAKKAVAHARKTGHTLNPRGN